MNWGQTGYSLPDLHVELVLGPRCWTWWIISNCYPPTSAASNPLGFICDQVLACPRTDIQDDIHRERCEYNAMQCNVDKQQRSNTCYASRSTKHQYEHDLTHKMVMGDTFTLQDLVKGWNAAKHNSTIGATHPEALRRTPLDIGDIKLSWVIPSHCKSWCRYQTNWNSAKHSIPIRTMQHPEALRSMPLDTNDCHAWYLRAGGFGEGWWSYQTESNSATHSSLKHAMHEKAPRWTP